jgi:hypothetical protein
MANVLVYGSDSERLKGAAAKLRSQGCKIVNLRDHTRFRIGEVEPSYDAIILLEPCDIVKNAYEAYNSRVSDDKKLEIREEYSFQALTPKEMAAAENRPYWPDMTVKELLEYALENFEVKLIGSTKKEIIDRVDLLWKEKNSKRVDAAVQSEDA